jgi:cytochrome P450
VRGEEATDVYEIGGFYVIMFPYWSTFYLSRNLHVNSLLSQEALHVTYEILIESVFSMSLKEIGFSSEEFLEAQEIYTRELIRRFFLPFRRYMFWDSGVKECKKATQLLLDFAQRAIDNYRSGKARNRFVSEGEEGFTIMNHVMNHSYLSEEHRLSDVVLFMVAGNETTTNTLTFVVYSMIKHPEALSKLRAELDAIDPSGAWLSDEKEGGEESEQRGGGGRRLMTYTDLANAECLHNYIREVQR